MNYELLSQDIQYLPGVGPNRKKMLSQELGIENFGDLLQYFPYKHVDRSRLYNIHELTGNMPFVQVKGHILSFETFKMSARKERVVAHFTDGSGKVMDLTWFNGGKYAKQSYKIGTEYIVFGRPNVYNGRINVTHPDIDAADKLELSTMGMQPYYNTTEKMKKSGLNSRCLERLVKTLLDVLKEPIAEDSLSTRQQRIGTGSCPTEIRRTLLCPVEHPQICQRPSPQIQGICIHESR